MNSRAPLPMRPWRHRGRGSTYRAGGGRGGRTVLIDQGPPRVDQIPRSLLAAEPGATLSRAVAAPPPELPGKVRPASLRSWTTSSPERAPSRSFPAPRIGRDRSRRAWLRRPKLRRRLPGPARPRPRPPPESTPTRSRRLRNRWPGPRRSCGRTARPIAPWTCSVPGRHGSADRAPTFPAQLATDDARPCRVLRAVPPGSSRRPGSGPDPARTSSTSIPFRLCRSARTRMESATPFSGTIRPTIANRSPSSVSDWVPQAYCDSS